MTSWRGVRKGHVLGLCRTSRPIASRSRGNKGILAAQEMFGSAFCQNFDNVPPRHIMDSWCGNGATRLRAGQRGRVEYKKAPDLAREGSYATRPGAGVANLEETTCAGK